MWICKNAYSQSLTSRILCSLESPKERINMEEVIKELQLIKSTFVGLGIRRGRPSRTQVRGISF